ncbi:DUF346 domain-containing protein [Umezawaea tangerina]|uniref:Repeat uncharacterized protein DUF346 n=1 Tax=Umezawaea tangerina TaxID=84725 RepID=A0A2T0SGA0_9PSEU|nr:DUF346 domain-containing protein [Umezawaea tangerina]PRY32432.1 repeat uncharacterized protein DUF346 [Umezawaea tangerina]
MRTTRLIAVAASLLATAVLLGAPTAGAQPDTTRVPAGVVMPANCPSIPPDRDLDVTTTVHQVGLDLGVSDTVMLSGFETGWVESHMNNLPCGDRDSLGVFQQRPSQGWGTPAEIMDVRHASTSYFTRAINSERNHPAYSAAQIAWDVQRSCCPQAYADAQAKAQSLLAEVAGSGTVDGVGGARAFKWGDQQLIFSRGTDGALHHWYWIPGEGTRSDSWGGTVVGEPTGFAYGNQEHVFARGPNNTLLHWWWIDDGSGLHFADWGGEAYGDPTAFVWNGQQHIFAKNAAGQLFHWFWDPTDLQVHTVTWSGAPGAFVGGLSSFAYKNQQHVVARGPNNTLYHWWWDQATGQVTFADWGGQAYSDPTAFVWNGQQHIFAKNAAGQLFHWFWDPTDHQVHTVTWSGAPGTFVGTPFGYSFGNQQHVVARGPNNTLYHWWWDQATGQVTFADWGGQAYGDPVAFVYGDQQQIFATSARNTLYHWWWTPQEGGQQNDWGGNAS